MVEGLEKKSVKATTKKTVKRSVDKESVKVETVKKKVVLDTTTSSSVLAEALKDVKQSKSSSSEVVKNSEVKEKIVKDSFGRVYATGKRKTSIARVWIKAGKGNIVVNNKDYASYFRRPVLQMIVNQPFVVASRSNAYDVVATLQGGGLSGQAGALKHGISKALVLFEPELRDVIKKAGFLTRDSRVVERKHYGHKKARRSFQFSKR